MGTLLNRRRYMGGVDTIDWSKQYLTFEVLESGTFQLSRNAVNYSLDDGVTWINLAADTATPTISEGSKIIWKANITSFNDSYGLGTFSSTGAFDLMGNLLSLTEGDNFGDVTTLRANYCFRNLFNGSKVRNANNFKLIATTLKLCCYAGMFANSKIELPPELPATTLARQCYWSMFAGCTSLRETPELLATTLDISCYQTMFKGDTLLTEAPFLPATTLVQSCYSYMFQNCSNLEYIKAMFLTTPSNTYTADWVQNVKRNGTFVKNSSATWDVRGNSGIPNNWTVETASE